MPKPLIPAAADALRRAESFIAGFEDDPEQNVAGLLADIRVTLAGAPADPARDAGPQLLAALHKVRGWYVEQYGEMYALDEVNAAITKAEGRS